LKTFRLLTWFTQLALSVVVPLLLCIWGAVYLRDRFLLGSWIVILGIVLGFGGAISSFRTSLQAMKRESEADSGNRKDPPVSFNDHL